MPDKKPLFKNHLAQTTPFPIAIEIDKADGIYLWDTSGKRYIDLISGVGVSALGHNNEVVKSAIKNQVDKHMHVMVYGEYLQESQNKLADLLSSTLPKSLDCCYFVNSGTEANEAALKLAKRATGRSKIVSCKGSYHGSTHGSMSVSGNETKKAAFRPLLPEVYFIEFNEENDLVQIDENTACVIIETIQGDAGVRIPDKAYMKALRSRCDEIGALLIFDEIQAGIGRAGSLYAFELFDVIPDILTLGKALGAGMPMGAMISSQANMELLSHSPMLGHITTFGGHPVVCAAAHAGLEYMLENKIVDSVTNKGKLIHDLLIKHPAVKEIRYRGLFFAIDLESEDQVQKVVDFCLEKGVICFWFLSCPSSFRIAPPLVISEEEIHEACALILEGFNQV